MQMDDFIINDTNYEVDIERDITYKDCVYHVHIKSIDNTSSASIKYLVIINDTYAYNYYYQIGPHNMDENFFVRITANAFSEYMATMERQRSVRAALEKWFDQKDENFIKCGEEE